MSPRVTAKLTAWKRAGLLGPQTIRAQIAALETSIDREDWSAEVSGDLDELHELIESMERPA